MSEPLGILVVDKPAGVTSHGVVAQVRRAFDTRKVGHAGTLDPDATGVLVLGLGQATRLLGYLAAGDKEYTSTIVLGVATVTDDAAGDIVARGDVSALDADAIRAAIEPLTGAILQRPSAVSAIKVDGKRSYDLVRSGEDVELPPRPVTVASFQVLDVREETHDGHPVVVVDVCVECSAGTYIRALARDLGEALGVGGHVRSLRRTRSGQFTLEDAVTVDALDAQTPLLTPGEAAARSLPCVEIDESLAAQARHGVQVPWPADAPTGAVAFLSGGALVAIGEQRGGRAGWLAVWPGGPA